MSVRKIDVIALMAKLEAEYRRGMDAWSVETALKPRDKARELHIVNSTQITSDDTFYEMWQRSRP